MLLNFCRMSFVAWGCVPNPGGFLATQMLAIFPNRPKSLSISRSDIFRGNPPVNKKMFVTQSEKLKWKRNLIRYYIIHTI